MCVIVCVHVFVCVFACVHVLHVFCNSPIFNYLLYSVNKDVLLENVVFSFFSKKQLLSSRHMYMCTKVPILKGNLPSMAKHSKY